MYQSCNLHAWSLSTCSNKERFPIEPIFKLCLRLLQCSIVRRLISPTVIKATWSLMCMKFLNFYYLFSLWVKYLWNTYCTRNPNYISPSGFMFSQYWAKVLDHPLNYHIIESSDYRHGHIKVNTNKSHVNIRCGLRWARTQCPPPLKKGERGSKFAYDGCKL